MQGGDVNRPKHRHRRCFAYLVAWSDPAGGVWVLRPMAPARQADWYRHGALYVSGVGGMATCADWVVAR